MLQSSTLLLSDGDDGSALGLDVKLRKFMSHPHSIPLGGGLITDCRRIRVGPGWVAIG